MKISGVKIGDIVECDIKGRRFLAIAGATDGSGLKIEPVHAAITYRHVTARQVIAHWSKRGRQRPAAGTD